MHHKTSVIDCVKKALVDTPPDPLYQRFQRTKQGVIVGIVWYSVEYCWPQGIAPGWYCFIEHDGDHDILHEDDVELEVSA